MTPIYHITHISNLAGIMKAGALWCDSGRVEQGFPIVGIAHQNIKARRAKRLVPLAAKGTVADYVPFYFAPRSPMLYAIDRGAVEGYGGGQAAVLHLVSAAETASSIGRAWCFTDGHAEMGMTAFCGDLSKLCELVDFDVMASQYWNDTPEHPDRKRLRQAEFLVHERFPWEYVQEIGVYDAATRARVTGLLAMAKHRPPVRVRADWYY